jgi:hypothetical protein
MARPITLPEPFMAMALHVGTVRALADSLGTTPMTVWRWAHGVVPGEIVRRAVNGWATRRGLPAPWPANEGGSNDEA